MQLVDTHQHLWDLDLFPCSWCAGIPRLNRSFRLPDYLAAAQGLGIEKTIFVECDVDPPRGIEEARHIQSLAEQHSWIAGLVANGRVEEQAFPTALEQLVQLPKVRGLRRVLHTQPDELSQSPLFAENVRRLSSHGLTFDLCVLARQLPLARALAQKCPEVSFVLDHCGVPDVKGCAFDPWREQIRAIAQLPNVACKISGLVAYADPDNWKVDDLRPWVEHVWECFGWERVLWGSDWPVCTLSATLRQWVEAIQTLTAGISETNRKRLFQRNAERIYRV